MEETKQTDVSSLPEVQPNKKLKKSLSDKQRLTLEEGRKKRWLKKQKEIRDQEKVTAKNAEVTNTEPQESVEQEEAVVEQVQEFDRKRYDEEPLRWTERLKLAEEEGGDQEEAGDQAEESDHEQEGADVEQEDEVNEEEESGSDVGSDTDAEEEEEAPPIRLPRNHVRSTSRPLPKFQTPPTTTRRLETPKAPKLSSRKLLKDKVRSTLVERLVDRYLENKEFHTTDNKRLGEMMFY